MIVSPTIIKFAYSTINCVHRIFPVFQRRETKLWWHAIRLTIPLSLSLSLSFTPLDPSSRITQFFSLMGSTIPRKPRKIQIEDRWRLITAELNGECRFGNWISYRVWAEPSSEARYLTWLRAINVLIGDKGSLCSPWHPLQHDLYTYGLRRRCIHYLITLRQVNAVVTV